jgi:nitrate reductase NapE component
MAQTAHENVRPRPSAQNVGTWTASQGVCPIVAVEFVASAATENGVVAAGIVEIQVSTGDLVVTWAGVDQVISEIPPNEVCACAGAYAVITWMSHNAVLGVPGDDHVVVVRARYELGVARDRRCTVETAGDCASGTRCETD